MKTFFLYIATALAEIVGCYLPWLWLRHGGSAWLLLPAAASLALFAWVYIGAAIAWLWAVDGVRPSVWDATGAAVALLGMGIIAFQPR